MRWLLLALFVVAVSITIGRAGTPVYPTCATIGGVNPCVTTADLMGDIMVNIRFFGAKGDNVTDDTAAIQAAIDYAANNNLQGIYCPSGNYKTTSSLYLDPPGNLRSNLSNPPNFSFSLAFVGEGHGAGQEVVGCTIRPNFNNTVAFYVGPGQRMRVSDIAIIAPFNGYRGNQNSAGVGLGTTGGAGGSSGNLIENVWVENFYTAFKTQANGACCLNDSNKWSRVVAINAFYGLNILGGQTDINVVDQSHLQGTVAIFDGSARQTTIIGGDMGSGSGQANSFSISGTGNLLTSTDPIFNVTDISFTTTVASPDIYIPNVYSAFTLSTTFFGIVPMTMTNWNAATNVGTFQLLTGWIGANYGNENLQATTALQTDIQAAGTLYATELTKVFWGAGFHAMGVHIENPAACTTVLQAGEGSSGDFFTKLENIFYNMIISHTPAVDGSSNAIFFCQQTFPFILQERGANGVEINGGNFLQDHGYNLDGVIIDSADNSLQAEIKFRNLGMSLWAPNLRYYGSVSNILSIIGNFFNPYSDAKSQGHGFGIWDATPFFSHNAAGITMHNTEAVGEIYSPYCGYRPCPWTTPSMPPGLSGVLTSTLGALGSYPLPNCETIYRNIDWNTVTTSKPWIRTASCPMMSYGQNLTNANVGETISWYYKGQTNVVYMSPKLLSWMRSGLAIGLPDPVSGTDTYIVTGVYPTLGYVTVLFANTNAGTVGLAGNKNTVFTGGQPIVQVPYGWTQYQ